MNACPSLTLDDNYEDINYTDTGSACPSLTLDDKHGVLTSYFCCFARPVLTPPDNTIKKKNVHLVQVVLAINFPRAGHLLIRNYVNMRKDLLREII